ncbi:Slx4p interacting protein [Madurella fahalii]|uniref:Slx4p interacting protein n=1 Tax=Madurella fahalii TaxID=1157608 RepID=A0ABQ0GA09_9PEZI
MAVKCKPIPALYTVYILRSTVRHASLYIGSTPNPPRRLSQHNGLVTGGAARTSRHSLRPWEMVGLVSGFPSMTAALKFEWALTNPHISVHIPSGSRITISNGVKANGQPRRPSKSLVSVLSNLHLLLRVPSFARWPLKLHFFVPEVYAVWRKQCAAVTEKLRPGFIVATDFGGEAQGESDKEDGAAVGGEEGPGEGERAQPRGIHALPLDYEPIKDYVAKGQDVFAFERQGNCVVCREAMSPEEGLQALCTNAGCEGVGHLSCWSRHFLAVREEDSILPVQGRCPKCDKEVLWGDMMKELTLRVRGPKDVEKLLKRKRRRITKKASTAYKA